MAYELTDKKVWVAGHRGMVGSALMRRLERENCVLLTADRQSVDLTRQSEVEEWIKINKPQVILLAAAKVGGIHANSSYPADFIYDNLMIETNIIDAAWRFNIEKLLFLGSSCIYPRQVTQPIKEDTLLSGPLEQTNEWYAVAKIAGIKMCQAYRRQYGCDLISAMPTNLFGPGDNFHPENSHVPAALLDRFHKAKMLGLDEVTIWGSGTPRREFLYIEDLADACIFLIRHYSEEEIINIGVGRDISIGEFALLISNITGFNGRIVFDTNHPDGTPQKLLDVSRLTKMGWQATTGLDQGLKSYYEWYLKNIGNLRT
uniref:GDP-L-fucose synthase n=1 Tax=Candidatus Kentrum sp. TUN TaxID=2126343 RepID=A0A451A8Y8_9GAMM|nr:MAG: GDP-L-fucose synthase [Candidatus Kentron sp. TUN]VFK62493.1 MAG: GDP-L-fucose synthase [Candidatus Kentron sp. TUN]